MPGRYEIVDEPVEALEVIDDEVYHPDLTVRDTPATSFRSLEPIVAGPITLKTIFYDPRWSANKRRGCILFVTVASLVCFSLMISLFVGLGQVISYINESERLKQTGLFMVPDLEQAEIGLFLYNAEKRFSPLHEKYIADLDAYLKKYKEQEKNKNYQTCGPNQRAEPGKTCRFDLNWLGTNCTSENRYGYDSGNPCILFVFRNVHSWKPNITDAYLNNREELHSRQSKGIQHLDQYHLPFFCTTSYTTSIKTTDEETFVYYPEAGFNLTFIGSKSETELEQLPPLVFVQFLKPPYKDHPQINVKCQIYAPNTSEFKGIQTFEFEFDDADDIQGSQLERP